MSSDTDFYLLIEKQGILLANMFFWDRIQARVLLEALVLVVHRDNMSLRLLEDSRDQQEFHSL